MPLCKTVEQRNAQRRRNYALTRKHNGKKPWTPEEDVLILLPEDTDRVLSGKIERSVQAIQVRRSRVKELYAIPTAP